MFGILSIFVMGIALNSGDGTLIKLQAGDGETPTLIFRNMLSQKQHNWHHFAGNPVLKPEAPYEL